MSFLTFTKAVKILFPTTVSRCYAALRQLRQIRRSVPPSTFQSLVVTLVLSRLDYGNAVLVGLPTHLVRRLQSAQNAAARLIYHMRSADHITDTLVTLHWLCVPQRIDYKVAVMTYKVVHGIAPRYLGPLAFVADADREWDVVGFTPMWERTICGFLERRRGPRAQRACFVGISM